MSRLLAVLVVALVGVGAAWAGPPRFTAVDAAHARTLLRSTLTGAPREWVRCMPGEALVCRRFGKPALANRYYLDRFVWERASGPITLTYEREGRVEMVAIVRGISASSFLIARVLYHR